jgi:hypothetical protein
VKVNVRALGEALAVRLNRELPNGCWLTCDTVEGWGGVALFMNTAEGSWGGSGIAGMADSVDVDQLPFVTQSILDAIQDDVAHASKGVAWPSDPAAEIPLPEAWARLADAVLVFGYGSRALGEGIPLAEIAVIERHL